jgi:hypothetical protein
LNVIDAGALYQNQSVFDIEFFKSEANFNHAVIYLCLPST